MLPEQAEPEKNVVWTDAMDIFSVSHNASLAVMIAASSISGGLMIEVFYWTTPNGHKITIF